MADVASVKIRFAVDTKYGRFSDALYYTPDEYAVLDPAVLEAEKQARADNYVAMRDAQALVQVAKEDYEDRVAGIAKQVAELQAEAAQYTEEAKTLPARADLPEPTPAPVIELTKKQLQEKAATAERKAAFLRSYADAKDAEKAALDAEIATKP